MIKRRTAHLIFALVGVGLTGAIAFQGARLHQLNQLTAALDSVPDILESIDEVDVTQAMHDHPAVQLSVGSALANGGNLEEAERIFNSLVSDSNDERINIGAQYNLANAYLRQALSSGTETTSQTLPMVELAKQRYRDLLSDKPEHWPARYNLERALRMAPEGSDRIDDGRIEPVKSVDVIVPGFEKQDLP